MTATVSVVTERRNDVLAVAERGAALPPRRLRRLPGAPTSAAPGQSARDRGNPVVREASNTLHLLRFSVCSPPAPPDCPVAGGLPGRGARWRAGERRFRAEAQRRVRHGEHVVAPFCDDADGRGHAGLELEIRIVDVYDGVIGDDVLHDLRRVADVADAAAERIAGIGIDRERHAHVRLQPPDVGLRDVRMNFHFPQVLRDRENHGRGQRCGDGLPAVHGARDHHAVGRRQDVGVAQVRLRGLERGERLRELSSTRCTSQPRMQMTSTRRCAARSRCRPARETCSRACWPVRARARSASTELRELKDPARRLHEAAARYVDAVSQAPGDADGTAPPPLRWLSDHPRPTRPRHGRATWTTDRHCATVITKKKMDQGKQEQALWQQATDNVDKA